MGAMKEASFSRHRDLSHTGRCAWEYKPGCLQGEAAAMRRLEGRQRIKKDQPVLSSPFSIK